MAMKWSTWTLLIVLTLLFASFGSAQPLADPDAQATRRARQEEWRNMDPEARATRRAEMQEERRRRQAEMRENMPPVRMELSQLLPLPIEVKNPRALVGGGKPAGGVCPGSDSCTLSLAPAAGEVIVVTAVWSATKIECDGVKGASPPEWRSGCSVVAVRAGSAGDSSSGTPLSFCPNSGEVLVLARHSNWSRACSA